MELLHMILPIVIGAAIGYFTNYIAIKMLFHPRTPIYIGKWKLPFTPGVIPKNQERIAKAVGNAVGKELFTSEDLVKEITESVGKGAASGKITRAVMNSEKTVKSLCEMGQVNSEDLSEKISTYISGQIINEVRAMDFQPTIKIIAEQSLDQFLNNPMIAMFLGEDQLNAIYARVNDALKVYVEQNGEEIVSAFVAEKINEMSEQPVGKGLSTIGIGESDMQQFIEQMFDDLFSEAAQEILEKIDISGIVQSKINEMKVDELEKLVMSVMKHELQTIVNLGALIGALIGILNIFV